MEESDIDLILTVLDLMKQNVDMAHSMENRFREANNGVEIDENRAAGILIHMNENGWIRPQQNSNWSSIITSKGISLTKSYFELIDESSEIEKIKNENSS